MQLHLGGHLNWYEPCKRGWITVPLAEPTPLAAVLARLGVPASEVAIVTINRRVVALCDARVSDSDTVELYPPIGGG
jgi:sulfur carrier protein ThiS